MSISVTRPTHPIASLAAGLATAVVLALLPALPASAALFSAGTDSAKSSFLEGTNTDKFLPPDQAFGISMAARDRQTLQADFKIAPGHYLYRERIKFEIAGPAGGTITQV